MKLRVVQRRGGAFEAAHEVDAVLCDASGAVLASVGRDPVTTFRSAAKPFQLASCLEVLGGAAEGLRDRDLAIGAASHHGEPGHVAQVRSLLSRFGRSEDDLFCGAHAPTHGPSAEALFASGRRPTAIHNNCSGKHTFMAAACAVAGWPRDYRPLSHPLQQRVLEQLQGRTGRAVEGGVIDGCGVPCWVLRLSAMGRAWAALADCAAREPGSPLGRIVGAMSREPWMVSGTDAFDGWLMQRAPAVTVAKVGAEGLLCAALLERRQGLAVKLRSGSSFARAAAVHALLRRWVPELAPPELDDRFYVVRNAVGAPVGELRAEWG